MRRTVLLFLAAVALVPAASAQRRGGSGRHLSAFRSEGEVQRYLDEIAAARERAQQQEWERRSRCAQTASARRHKRRHSAGDSAVIVGIVESSGGSAVSAATVDFVGERRALSDANGRFRIAIPAGSLPARGPISARRIGLQPRALPVRVEQRDSVSVRLTLCPATTQLEGAVVTTAYASTARSDVRSRDESITNNQEGVVDEGGIVKLHGRHLVVLRRGRLFTIEVGDRALRPVAAVDAFGPDIDPRAAWYDELITHGDRVVVAGYSYQRGGSELGIFRIDSLGGLHHLSTYQLRSNDYYSARNYASRVVDGKLVMYTPLYLDSRNLLATLPAMRRWTATADTSRFRPTAMPTRIFRPVQGTRHEDLQALHSLTTCELAAEPFSCSSTVVIGPAARVSYVSPSAVYLWVSPWRSPRERGHGTATLYRMPLDGGAPSAVKVSGSPVDQFSFSERSGELDVLVRGEAAGDAMWRSLFVRGTTALARVPLNGFGDGTDTLDEARYTFLPGAGEGEFHNRFVGKHLLYGAGAGWIAPSRGASYLFVLRIGADAPTRVLLPHGIDRIEAMGGDAVVIGAAADSLHFTGIGLRGTPRPMQHMALANAAQGEQRSHGFFYKPETDGVGANVGGMIGLPVASAGRRGYEHLRHGSASVAFVRNDGQTFTPAGELEARSSQEDDDCRASCIDWYGNARPIFLRGRAYALLGYELVEGAISGGTVREVGRVSFAPAKAANAAR